MAEEGEKLTIILKSSDDKDFEVDIKVAKMSETIKNILDDLGLDDETPIPLPNVYGNVLDKVIKYCEYHKNDPPSEDPNSNEVEIVAFDVELMKEVDQGMLFEMILAANFLDIKPMLDLTCKTLANMIKGKTPEEIRTTFNIENDFTLEEEEQLREETEWTEERP